MIGGRASDVDEVRPLSVEHQLEVIVHADVRDEAHRMMAPFRDGIMNRDDVNARPRTPSGKMRLRRDLAEAGNRSAQHYPEAETLIFITNLITNLERPRLFQT